MALEDRIRQIEHKREHIHAPPDLGSRASDLITGFVGSWLFVGMHAVWFILWIALRPEPFPFGLLTLLVSLEAIFLSTFVMMSQNRQADKDRRRDDHEADEVELLFRINQTQLEILQLLHATVCPADGARAKPSEAGRREGGSKGEGRAPAAVSTGGAPRARKGSQRRRR